MFDDLSNVSLQESPPSGAAGTPMTADVTSKEPSESETALIKRWESKSTKAKAKWEPDFKRMRANMEFATGLQYKGQQELDCVEYLVNLTLQMVNRKVSTLYAKNPTVEVTRRKRMDYQIWDESIESLTEAMTAKMQWQMMGSNPAMAPIPALALVADFEQGHQHRLLVQRFASTLQILIQYFFDVQSNDFKEQLKQAVRRTVICGAAFGRVVYCVADDQTGGHVTVPSSGPTHNALDLAERAQQLVKKLQDDPAGESDPRHEELITYAKSLAASLGAKLSGTDDEPLPESFEFDFPLTTSVYPDASCRSLTNFVGASAIFIESLLPVEYVNSLFNSDVKASGGAGEATLHTASGQEMKGALDSDSDKEKGKVCVLEVQDILTKTHFFICKGHKKFLLAPEPFQPPVNGFWDMAALTFNSIEVDPATKTSVYPPSDVQNMKHIQMEWNRTGNAQRDHRNAAAPRWCARKGTISEDDIKAIEACKPNQVIQLDSIPVDGKITDWIIALPTARIDPLLYEKASFEKDLQYAVGMQEANIGPAKPNVTATVGSIAEQSRVTVTSSNVDDLDGFLSTLARMVGEKAIRVMSKQTVQAIVGTGALTWPETAEARRSLLHEVDIGIKAASSGRPNKALEIQNAKELGPLIMQAIQGAAVNPAMAKPMSALVEEYAKRLDDQIDVTKFFLSTPPPMAAPPEGAPPPNGKPGKPHSAAANRDPNGNRVPRGPSGPNAHSNNRIPQQVN